LPSSRTIFNSARGISRDGCPDRIRRPDSACTTIPFLEFTEDRKLFWWQSLHFDAEVLAEKRRMNITTRYPDELWRSDITSGFKNVLSVDVASFFNAESFV